MSDRRTVGKRKHRRGGKRAGAGRPKSGNVRLRVTVKSATATKIEKLRKADSPWKRRGQVVDEILKPISVAGAEFLDLAR